MPDYSFYTGVYGGVQLENEAFAVYVLQAADVLEGLERRYTISYPTLESQSKALCAIAEALALEATMPRGVSSVKVGSVSTAYTGERTDRPCYQALCRYADVYRGAKRHSVLQ